MTWTADGPGISIDRDGDEIRLLRHFQSPFEGPSADTPHKLVLAYLTSLQRLLGIPDAALGHLATTIPTQADEPGETSVADGLQLRWARAFSIRDETTVLVIQQTHTIRLANQSAEGLPIEYAGLRVLVHHMPKIAPRIVALASTLVREPIEVVQAPSAADVAPRGSSETCALSKDHMLHIHENFGLSCVEQDCRDDTIPDRFLHRFEPGGTGGNSIRRQSEPLVAGRYYVANAVRVTPRGRIGHLPAHDLVFREGDFAPMRSEALVTHAGAATGTAVVFESDPVSATGDFKFRPNAAPAVLDHERSLVTLQNLCCPTQGQPWTLSGKNVHVCDRYDPPVPGWIGIRPPSSPEPPSFIFGSRTNDFAAVNAYYHVDHMLAFIESIGLPFPSFPMHYTLPIYVVHRAEVRPGFCSDGKCVNAQAQVICLCVDGKVRYTALLGFALANLSRNPGSIEYPIEPLGIACDARIVWHEFCHALIAASTDFPEFPFAHSAGDALAAINSDPDSRLATEPYASKYRGVTYPWGETPTRRHDRLAADGWSWSSALGQQEGYERDIHDMYGYAREQVLSSTLFRLYRSIGGDAVYQTGNPDRATRKAAAIYSSYLIIRAIWSLGPERMVPVRDAEAFALALAEADIGTATLTPPLDRIGGTVHKVVRWAFEKQGLYQKNKPPLPDGSGWPEPVDVYIEDGRGGEYGYEENWQATPDAVWNSIEPYPDRGDETPIRGADNFIFVRVKNRGDQPARSVRVCVSNASQGDDTIWPSANWTRLPLAGGAATIQSQSVERNDLIFGPFVWQPADQEAYSFLVQVDAEGDLSNLNPVTGLPCARATIPLATVVPLDNNIGLRTIRLT
jgi:hypothetical protein